MTTVEARAELTKILNRFREQGARAEPVVFGSHRKAEAVLLPYEAFEELQELQELAEELGVARKVRERDARDSGERRTLSEVAAELDVDLDEL